MQSFEIKRGHGKSLEDGGLRTLMEEEFGEVTEKGNNVKILTASYKALTKIDVDMVSITEVKIETETDSEAEPDDALKAHQAYNRFMEKITGFNAKQRVDRAKAKAKKEAKAAAEKEIAAEKAAEESTEEPAEETEKEETS